METNSVPGWVAVTSGALPKKNVTELQKRKTIETAGNTGSDTASAPGKSPIVDTVEIAGNTGKPQVFDPTFKNGTFAQKHVDGVLATSSSIDGYNGWEAMLKHEFGIQNGGDRSDMPVIPYFTHLGCPGSYGVENGYVPANKLTHEQRNLLANMYVYAHDHGISEATVGFFSSTALRDPGEGYHLDSIGYIWSESATSDDWKGVLEGRASKAEYLRRGVIQTPRWFDQPDEVYQTIVRTLSSEAINDNLIPKEWIVEGYGCDRWGSRGVTLKRYQDQQKLIYAYSRNNSDGKLSAEGIKSVEAQRYISWREANFNQVRELIAESKQPGTKTPDTKTLGVSNQTGTPDSSDVFGRYSKRIAGLISSLNDSQKAMLGNLYKLASEKKDGSSDALEKVDALAKAMVTSNFMEIMFLPGKDKEGKKTTNLLDMLVRTKELPDQTKLFQTTISKQQEQKTGKFLKEIAQRMTSATLNAKTQTLPPTQTP